MVEAVASVVDAATPRRLHGGHLERLVRFCGRRQADRRLNFRRGSCYGFPMPQTRLLDGDLDVVQLLQREETRKQKNIGEK